MVVKKKSVEILVRFLKNHCAKLALPDMGSHLQGFFYRLKRKKYEPMANCCTRHRNEYTKVRRALARLRRDEETEELAWHDLVRLQC